MPSGPGVIPEERIAEIAATVPPGVSSFLLTSETDVAAIAGQQRRCGVDVIQLCDELTSEQRVRLRAELPGVRLVQVVHVTDESAVARAAVAAVGADALLLDSGNPEKRVKELGGTGRVHDWVLSRRIGETVSVPVYLAGGLNPGNVAEAIATVRPFGVDVCSGLRTDDRLDEQKLAAFVAAIAGAEGGRSV
jgi:phosphoribosylanthranilate isomerase